MEGVAYSLDKRFIVRLLSLVLVDRAFGIRVIEALDAERLPSVVAVLWGILSKYTASTGALPSDVVIEQLITHQSFVGKLSEEEAGKVRRLLGAVLKAEPLTRDEAVTVLRDAILDVEVIEAIDDVYKLSGKREYSAAKERFDQAFERARALELGSIGSNLFLELNDYLSQIGSGKAFVPRIPFGIDSLDLAIKGGVGRGEMGCVLAEMKAGKSLALCHVAASDLLLGYKVVYITLELSESEVTNRIVCNMTGTHIDALEKGGHAISRTIADRLEKIYAKVDCEFVVKQFPSKSARVSDIEAYLADVRRIWGWSPDVLIVDYADELISDKGSTNSSSEWYHSLGNIYSQLRALGSPPESSYSTRGGYNCAVWTASQVNRDGVDKDTIGISNVSDSILKVAKVDLMLALCRNDDERESEQHRIVVTVCRYAKAEGEFGPYSRDYVHGRLIEFDETVKRFAEGAEWVRRQPRTRSRLPMVSLWPIAPSSLRIRVGLDARRGSRLL